MSILFFRIDIFFHFSVGLIISHLYFVKPKQNLQFNCFDLLVKTYQRRVPLDDHRQLPRR